MRYFIYEQRRLVSDCRTIDNVSQDHVERFSRLDKEGLLNVTLMYNEVVDGMLNRSEALSAAEGRSRDSEI